MRNEATIQPKAKLKRRNGFWGELKKYKGVYLMAIPGILFYLIFLYGPMFGVVIAFQDYSPALGFLKSSWVGLKHFQDFCSSAHFVRTVRNTLVISLLDLVLGFPAPIILALLLNELKAQRFKKIVQTITYIPHFISLVVICGIISAFSMKDGVFNIVLSLFGMERRNLLQEPAAFKWIYVFSGIWQSIGWDSIIYLAALSNIDQCLYEAASIDGAGKLRQVFAVTLPAIIPTIVTLFIMRMGTAFTVGYEKILLLYNSTIYETADVISTLVYRKGLREMNYSYSTAVGLFNSVVNLVMLLAANYISKKATETSLW